jgi:hypothetical protein
MSEQSVFARFQAAAIAASKPVPVPTKAFGLVHVLRQSVRASRELQASGQRDDAATLAACLCDESGALIFSAKDPNHMAILNDVSQVDVAPILLAFYAGNGLDEVGEKAAEKN